MAKGKSNPQFWQKVSTIATVAILVGAVGGLVAARPMLVERAAAMHVHAAGEEPPPVVIEWPTIPGRTGADGGPGHMFSEPLRRQLTELVRSELTPDPLDRDALQRAAERLKATGWVAELRSMRREPGSSSVRISALWRAPVALVRFKDRDHLVAAGGELLPISYPAGSVSTLRVITGVFTGPPDAYGEPWSGGDVQAALALLAYLQPTETFSQVTGIDVALYVKHKKLAIVTDQNTRVIWGSAPNEWKPGEPSTQQKLAWLINLRRDPKNGNRIDAGRAVVDLTVPYGVFTEATVVKKEDIKDQLNDHRGTETKPEPKKKSPQSRAQG